MKMKVCSANDRKRFRIQFQHLALIAAILSTLFASSQALSMPPGCKEVAIGMQKSYKVQKEWLCLVLKIDPTFVKNFISCAKGLYKLYQEANWNTVQKVVSPEVRKAISAAPKLAKAVGHQGALIMSAYFLFQTIELHEKASMLMFQHDLHRNEYETMFAKKIQPVLRAIDAEILPVWHLDELHSINKELRELVLVTQKNLEVSRRGEKVSLAYAFGTSMFSFASAMFGFHVPALVGIISTGISTASHISYSRITVQLQTLYNDLDKTCNEIDQYRIRLEQKSIYIVGVILFFLILVSFDLTFNLLKIVRLALIAIVAWIILPHCLLGSSVL